MPQIRGKGYRSLMSSFGSRTDKGLVREQNEDSLLVAPPLYVVCDGMGGHEAGEIASEIAVSTLAERAPEEVDANALGEAVEEANLKIVRAAEKGRGKPGMGTTCTAAMMDDDELVIAQVGDSRAYLLHQDDLQQITRDHSVVADLVEAGEITKEEARTHQWRSYITRALGLEPFTKPDLYEIDVVAGDRLLLCSDGLYSMVDDSAIQDILSDIRDPQRCADALVDAALRAGGVDNVTVIVADVQGDDTKQVKRYTIKSRITAIAIVVLLLVVIGGFCGAFGYWVNNTAYLGEVDGMVAIYKGVPGDVFGINFSSLEEVTNVSMGDLQPGTAQRIQTKEILCDSVDGAKALVQEYRDDIESRNSEEDSSSSSSSSSSDGSSSSGGSGSSGDSSSSSSGGTSASSSSSSSSSSSREAASTR